MDTLAPRDFAQRRAADWERLRILLARVQQGSLRTLNETELWELPGLYRKAIADLSLLRTQGAAPFELERLTHLCNQAHNLIYRGQGRRSSFSLWRYLTADLPQAVRRRAGYIWAAAAVMFALAVVGWFNCSMDRNIADAVLPPQIARGMETSLEVARKQSDLLLAAQIPQEDRAKMAVAITINNIVISIQAFVTGIGAGIPTIYILANNGYLLGVVTFIYFNTEAGIPINLPLYFVAGVAPHGSIELPAICVAAGAGLLLGLSWVFPGRRTRGQALRLAAVDAGRLALVCAITLVFAGMIEGFVTPLNRPSAFSLDTWFWAKIALGGVIFALWIIWLGLGGRTKERGVLSGGVQRLGSRYL